MPEIIQVTNGGAASIVRHAIDANSTDTITATAAVQTVNAATVGSQPAWFAYTTSDQGVVDGRRQLAITMTVDTAAAIAAGVGSFTVDLVPDDGAGSTTTTLTVQIDSNDAASGTPTHLYFTGNADGRLYSLDLTDPAAVPVHRFNLTGNPIYSRASYGGMHPGHRYDGAGRLLINNGGTYVWVDHLASSHPGSNTSLSALSTTFSSVFVDRQLQHVYLLHADRLRRYNYDGTGETTILDTGDLSGEHNPYIDFDAGWIYGLDPNFDFRRWTLSDPAVNEVKSLGNLGLAETNHFSVSHDGKVAMLDVYSGTGGYGGVNIYAGLSDFWANLIEVEVSLTESIHTLNASNAFTTVTANTIAFANPYIILSDIHYANRAFIHIYDGASWRTVSDPSGQNDHLYLQAVYYQP